MPPVLNTYGTKKKKRHGIPKYIFEDGPETDDVFEALNIENIKETKASLSEKAKQKLKKRKVGIQKPALSVGSYGDADTLFDQLLKEEYVRKSVPGDLSRLDVPSSPKLWCRVETNKKVEATVAERKRLKTFHGGVKPKIPSKKLTKSEGCLTLRGRHLKKVSLGSTDLPQSLAADQRGSGATLNPVLQEENQKKLQYRLLSPIPYLNSSTPFAKGKKFDFGALNCDTESFQRENISVGSCGSYEHQEYSTQENLNKALCIDSVCSDASIVEESLLKSSSDDAKIAHLPFNASLVCEYKDSNCSMPPSIILEDSCVLDGFCKNVNFCGSQCLCGSKSCSCISAYLSKEKRCRSTDDLGLDVPLEDMKLSLQSPEKTVDSCLELSTSATGSSHEFFIKDCSVRLTRLETGTQPSTGDHVDALMNSSNVSIILDDSCLSEDPDQLHSVGVESEVSLIMRVGSPISSKSSSVEEACHASTSTCHKLIAFKNCKVVLQRCDIERKPVIAENTNSCMYTDNSTKLPESLKPCTEVCHDLEPNNVVNLTVAENENVKSENSVSRPYDLMENSRCSSAILGKQQLDFQLEDSPSHSMSGRPSESFRPSNVHEAVVLKPGKQWRRSLSILSKIRLSTSDPCLKGKKPSLDDAKTKGKLWESAVNSIIQLQPAKEVILEDVVSSFGSLCFDDTLNLENTSCTSYDECIIVSEVSVRTSDITSASSVLSRCGQDRPLSFLECYPLSMKNNCKKIGEGVYGEVFLHSKSEIPVSVIKIIPIEGCIEINGEPQKTFREILSEVCIAQELSNLRNGIDNFAETFNHVQAIRCVQGCYPEWLQELWHDYNNSKGSENDCPDIFNEDQLFVILELGHGGKDLESFVFSSADQGLAAFKQIALSMAVGESALNFEHRDLHWGNVLLSNTKKKEIDFTLNGEAHCIPSKGVEVSIIDFTLSRMSKPLTGAPIFYDLSKDETLFTAQGDYQFEIYRMMKECCRNKWDAFTPKTNIVWLHYLLDKFCTMVRYRNRKSKVHSSAINILTEMKDTILAFENVTSFVKHTLFGK